MHSVTTETTTREHKEIPEPVLPIPGQGFDMHPSTALRDMGYRDSSSPKAQANTEAGCNAASPKQPTTLDEHHAQVAAEDRLRSAFDTVLRSPTSMSIEYLRLMSIDYQSAWMAGRKRVLRG